ncbi:hypothetical protein QBC35DRAFT_258415 [Podospora australis]|uniref:Uncharacterized protein n=1 Tax=Podospora australis TaxID=1536484 RepID=A0AAN6X2Z4_9PEZI|nr:hypothetical protein QBC35DRAFT_258415 [Podospora australis]
MGGGVLTQKRSPPSKKEDYGGRNMPVVQVAPSFLKVERQCCMMCRLKKSRPSRVHWPIWTLEWLVPRTPRSQKCMETSNQIRPSLQLQAFRPVRLPCLLSFHRSSLVRVSSPLSNASSLRNTQQVESVTARMRVGRFLVVSVASGCPLSHVWSGSTDWRRMNPLDRPWFTGGVAPDFIRKKAHEVSEVAGSAATQAYKKVPRAFSAATDVGIRASLELGIIYPWRV